jgi:hypothetical protein
MEERLASKSLELLLAEYTRVEKLELSINSLKISSGTLKCT